MSAVTVIVNAMGADPDGVARALESTGSQLEDLEVLLLGDVSAPGMQRAIGPHQAQLRVVDPGERSPGPARNHALAEASGRYVLLIDPGERLAAGALPRHLEALDAADDVAASYGRTAVHDGDQVRVRPEHGRGGVILKRLIKDKHLLASAACVLWRKEALGEAPFQDLHSPAALRLSLAVDLTRRQLPFVFHPTVVAEREAERLDLVALEELVKIFVGLLYSPKSLPEKLETRLRFRLARHLVAIGKHHYRAGDFRRAGNFFDEAVKAVPNYFKGRRYQFLNFVKLKVSGRGEE